MDFSPFLDWCNKVWCFPFLYWWNKVWCSPFLDRRNIAWIIQISWLVQYSVGVSPFLDWCNNVWMTSAIKFEYFLFLHWFSIAIRNACCFPLLDWWDKVRTFPNSRLVQWRLNPSPFFDWCNLISVWFLFYDWCYWAWPWFLFPVHIYIELFKKKVKHEIDVIEIVQFFFQPFPKHSHTIPQNIKRTIYLTSKGLYITYMRCT